ncbi:MAG: hypothetical protein Q9225_005441 [Loekoesia sp. 1 TL-2023]
MPHFPCLQFISDKLAHSKLYVIFILSSNEPFYIPAWPISRAIRSTVIKIFRKACQRFPTAPVWVSQIAYSSVDRDASALLEARPSDSYLIRRSLIQHETIFSGEGLTLLTVDHIYTFKKCLLTLSDTDSLYTDRKSHITSCTQLLRRINATYTGVKLSKSYLKRAYGIGIRQEALQEVHKAYTESFGEPGIQDVAVTVDSETPCLPELESPMDQVPMDRILALYARTESAPYMQTTDTEPGEAWDSDMWSPCNDLSSGSVTYPKVPALTKLPDSSSTSRPSSLREIVTTICSRCLVNLEAQDAASKQEMTMFLSPEWENFRRIGLGILRS